MKDQYWKRKSLAEMSAAEWETLPGWHPLITGRPESVHEAGISMLGKAISENGTDEYTVLR